MKKHLLAIGLVLATLTTKAQTSVYIPDITFLSLLLYKGVDTNNDKAIQTTEAEAVTSLVLASYSIKDMTGIQSFTNLISLYCNQTAIKALDVSKNTKLSILDCDQTQITSLDIRNNTFLTTLICNQTPYLTQICINSAQLSDTSSWIKDPSAKWSTNCNMVTGLEDDLLQTSHKNLERIYTPLGDAVLPENATSGMFIYQYSDGSTRKVLK